MAKAKDITGQKFNMLTALYPVGVSKNGTWIWMCKCDCGNEKQINSRNLHSGGTRSCGCLAKKARIENMKKLNGVYHGFSKEKLHSVWLSMRGRCCNPNNYDFKYYGGKGIQICEEWLEYESFKEWAFINGYSEGLTLDRIDSSKNYCPENCRWVDMKTQSNNKSNNVVIEYNGESHTLKEWAEILGINYSTVHKRYSAGKTIEQILKVNRKGECRG